MKKLYTVVICLLLQCLPVYAVEEPYNLDYVLGPVDETSRVFSQILPSPVIGIVNKTCPLYLSPQDQGNSAENVEKGTPVEILKDENMTVYLIRNADLEIEGWIEGKYIDFPQDEVPNLALMSPQDMEFFVNTMKFPGEAGFFVWVDIARQQVNVFSGQAGQWRHEKSMTCTTGKNTSPTTRGLFTLSERGAWFYSHRLKSGAKFWVRFNGAYLFHSVAMDINQNVVDNVLGRKHSSGCVRMAVEDAEWFYKSIPDGTYVFIY